MFMNKDYFASHFGGIEDSRYECFVEHKPTDVLILVMCGILCGLDGLQDIATYGRTNQRFFRDKFEIARIPSQSTLSRIMNTAGGLRQ
jgi:hypothetical protein